LTTATFATLIFVPVVYSILRRQPPRPMDEEDDAPSDPKSAFALSSPQQQ